MLQVNRKGSKTKRALQIQINKYPLGGWDWLSPCICLGNLSSLALTSPDMLVILDWVIVKHSLASDLQC